MRSAIIYPNVRGSTGYGKTFLAADNGFRREDSYEDMDPRVPIDEGQGFAKRRNLDFQFYTTIQFIQTHLLN